MRKTVFSLVLCCAILAVFETVAAQTYEAAKTPWSGYWWPDTEGELVNGYKNNQISPLKKYDLLTVGVPNGPAMEYGRDFFYNPKGEDWHGLCFNWAMASILEKEPRYTSVHKNIVFHVGDKKGLLTAFYYRALYENRYAFDPKSFHELLEKNIRDRKSSFVMDLGSAEEVWTYPVFKYETEYSQIGDIRHYETTIYYAYYTSPDRTGTMVGSDTYYYYFQLEGNVIVADGWESGSEERPPKIAYIPLGRKPLSNSFDFDPELIRTISNAKDDPYSGNNSFAAASPIKTGEYTLAALDSDFFKIYLEPSDNLKIKATPEIPESLSIRIYDPELNEAAYYTEDGFILFESTDPGYHYVKIEPTDPDENMTYKLNILQILQHQAVFPLDPEGNWVNGITFQRRFPEENGRVILSRIGKNGLPIESGDLDSNMKHYEGTCDSFNMFSPKGGYIRVDSDSPVFGMQALASGKYAMKGCNAISSENASDELFFPHLTASLLGGWKTVIGLINIGEGEEEILLQGYDPNGSVVASTTIVLAAGEKREYDVYNSFLINSESMRAYATSGEQILLGYLEYFDNDSGFGVDTVTAASTERRGPLLMMPHTPWNRQWYSGLAVMNTGNETTNVIFSAFDKGGELCSKNSHLLKPKQKLVRTVFSLFPDIQTKNISSIRIESESGEDLTGLALYGANSGMQLAGMPLLPPLGDKLFLPHAAESADWGTGLGVTNAGDQPTTLTLFLFDDSGDLLDTAEKSLAPGEQLLSTVRALFSSEPIGRFGYLAVASTGQIPLSAIYIIGSKDGTKLMGDTFLP